MEENQTKINLWKNLNADDIEPKKEKLNLQNLKTPQDFIKALDKLHDVNFKLQVQIYDLKNKKIPQLEGKIEELELQSFNILLKRVQALEEYVKKEIHFDQKLSKEVKTLFNRISKKTTE